MSTLRQKYRRGELTREQVAALERLPGWAWRAAPPYRSFEVVLRLLRRYVRREGHAAIPRGYVEGGARLGIWVATKRQRYARRRLSVKQRRALEAVPGWSWRLAPTPRRSSFEKTLAVLRRFVDREGHSRVPHSHVERGLGLGQWVKRQRTEFRKGRLAPVRARQLERLPGWSWSPLDRQFENMLDRLRRFARREGHALVPKEHPDLGEWVSSCRRAFKRGSLSPSRVAALESVPGWTWKARRVLLQRAEDRMLAALTTFIRGEGHSRVPRGHRENGVALGSWVAYRRLQYRGTYAGRPSPELVQRLESLPGWTWMPQAEAHFERMLALLRRYANREGHARVPQRHVEAGAPLGRWVATCRRRFRADQLGKAQAWALSTVPGWTRTAADDAREQMFTALAQYVRREGHARVPIHHREDGLPLGTWVYCRRAAWRRGRLPADMAQRLERLPGWRWAPNEDRFEHMLAVLQRYVRREGNADVPRSHVEAGERLGFWVQRRRDELRAGQLSKNRAAALEAVRGWHWQPVQTLRHAG